MYKYQQRIIDEDNEFDHLRINLFEDFDASASTNDSDACSNLGIVEDFDLGPVWTKILGIFQLR